MYVRIKVLRSNINTLESDVNREVKILESNNKLILDIQVIKENESINLYSVIIKHIDDEEKVALTGSIYEEEDDYCEIKNSIGRKW